MIEHTHLDNPPIKEALIDIRFSQSTDIGVKQLGEIQAQIGDRFPVRKPIQEGRFSLQFEVGKEDPPRTSTEHSVLGYRYESEDGSRVAQFRLNGFTYSRVGNYTKWEDMRDEAKDLWSILLATIKPDTVTRVATRFINVLPIPHGFANFEEYLTSPPRIPESLPQALSQFLTRVVVPSPEVEATAVITQALENPVPESVPIVLDIDVFSTGNFEAAEGTYWERLENLRRLKNDIFFASITKATKDLFK